MLFSTLYKIGKNFLSHFGDNSLIFIKKSFSFHASSMISFDSFDDNAKIVDERMMMFAYKVGFYRYEILIRYSLLDRQFLQRKSKLHCVIK